MSSHLIVETLHARYALPLSQVRSLCFLPQLSPPPQNAPACVVGLFNLRGQVLPVMDLALRFGRAPQPCSGKDVLVVVGPLERPVALRVESACDLVEIDAADLSEPAEFQQHDPLLSCFAGQARLDDGVLTVLDLAGLLQCPSAPGQAPGQLDVSQLDAAALQGMQERSRHMAQAGQVAARDLRSHLMVRVGEQCYAIDLQSVRELVRLRSVRGLPGCPSHVLGAMSLHGEVLAVLSLARLLEVEPGPGASQAAIVEAEGRVLALAVDEVLDIGRFAPQQIVRAAGEQGTGHSWCKALAHNERYTAGVIDVSALVSQPLLEGGVLL